jgi:hypothetical protein
MSKTILANTEQRVATTLSGLTRLFDLKSGSHLSRGHVMNYLRDAGEPDYLASDVIRGLQAMGVEVLDAADHGGAQTPTSGLDAFFQQSSIVDLDWLAVDRDAYRETEVVPVQNLNITPDLAELWDHSDRSPGVHLVPARPNDPGNAVGVKANRAAHLKAAAQVAEGIWTTMRTAMVAGKNFQAAKELGFQRLSNTDMPLTMKRALRKHIVQGIERLAAEEGLIGNVFVVAKDYPGCLKGVPREVSGSQAPFVIAKPTCQGCRFAQNAANTCAQFRKQLVMEVPYSEELARRFNVQTASKDPQVIKAALKTAFTHKPVAHVPLDGKPVERDITAGITVEQAAQGLQANLHREAAQREAAQVVATKNEIAAYAKRRMNEGLFGSDLMKAVRARYQPDLIKLASAELKTAFSEQALAGYFYIDASAYPNCHRGDTENLHRVRASLMRQRPDFVLRKTACAGCPSNHEGHCSQLKGALVDKMDYAPWGGRQEALVSSITWGRKRAATASEWVDEHNLVSPDVVVEYASPGVDVSGIGLVDADWNPLPEE